MALDVLFEKIKARHKEFPLAKSSLESLINGEDLGTRDPITKVLSNDHEGMRSLIALTKDDPVAQEMINSLRGMGLVSSSGF